MPKQNLQDKSLPKKAWRSERAAKRTTGATGQKKDTPASSADSPLRLGPNPTEREMVNHPEHYGGDTTHEVIKCLHAWGMEWDALLWNAVKYIARSGRKGQRLEDLKKAQFYLNRRIQQFEENIAAFNREKV